MARKKTQEPTAEIVDADPAAEVIEGAVEVIDAERAELDRLWSTDACGELEAIGAELRALLPGIKARRDVGRPAELGEQVLTIAELVKVLEEAGGDSALALRLMWRPDLSRRVGISIYVQLALAELGDGDARG